MAFIAALVHNRRTFNLHFSFLIRSFPRLYSYTENLITPFRITDFFSVIWLQKQHHRRLRTPQHLKAVKAYTPTSSHTVNCVVNYIISVAKHSHFSFIFLSFSVAHTCLCGIYTKTHACIG